MSKIAVIKTGGKQYLVKPGDKLKIEKLETEPGATVEFEVLMQASQDGKEIKVGTPTLEGAKATAQILSQGRAKKVRVVHYKSKTRQHKVYGHRQPYTQVEITKLS